MTAAAAAAAAAASATGGRAHELPLLLTGIIRDNFLTQVWARSSADFIFSSLFYGNMTSITVFFYFVVGSYISDMDGEEVGTSLFCFGSLSLSIKN